MALGWKPSIALEQGIALAYRDFLASRWATPNP
jgi:nucleoside-diphosphate-sugar epimerase